LVANWDISDALSLKYVGSSREGYSPTNIDFDNTGINLFDVPAVYDDENTTHEIQTNYIGDGFTAVAGVYLYDGKSCGVFDAILGGLGLTLETSGCNESESVAAYVQTSIDLNDKWSATLGARYTEEERKADVFYGFLLGAVYPSSGWVDGYTRAPEVGVPQSLGIDTNGDGILDAPKSETWSRFTPRLGLEYQYNDDTMFYASYAQGFKSGTFNPRASTNENAADPEIVNSFELGMKKDWGDTLRTNITLFSLEHDDRQYIVVVPDPNDATVLGQNLGNAAKSDVTGLEAEITYVATDNLTFDFSLGLLDADVEQDPNITTPLLGLSNTPDNTYALSANYIMDSDVGTFVFNAGYYYRDDYLIFEDNDVLQQSGYGMVNASVAWESNEGTWYGNLTAKNLTDEEYLLGGYVFVGGVNDDGSFLPGFGGDTTVAGYYGDPRTIHLTVGYRF
ncbi:MAG: TonB-dependent receptor, partial [Glaciecola sp.]